MTVPLKCVKVWGGERLSLAFQIINGNFAATQCRNGGIGRHEGLKIPWPVMAVRVRVPLAAQRFSCPKKQRKRSAGGLVASTLFAFFHAQNLVSPRHFPYLCIRQAALGKLKTSFLSARLHCLCIRQAALGKLKTGFLSARLHCLCKGQAALGQSRASSLVAQSCYPV